MIPTAIIEKLNPDPEALLAILNPLIDDGMLREIAEADYAQDVADHLAQLHNVRDAHLVVHEMDWCPHEVLALTRWGEPEPVWTDADPQFQRFHLMRAFACAALLRGEDDHDTLAQLLASLPVLGRPFQEAALCFLAWQMQVTQDDLDWDRPFSVFALLLLVLQTETDLSAPELQTMIDYLYEIEAKTRKEGTTFPQEPWLLGLDWHQRDHVWRRLGKEIGTYASRYQGSYIELALLDMADQLGREA